MPNGTSGWFDPLIAIRAYIDFATDAPRYGRLQEPEVINAIIEAYNEPGGCRDQLLKCSALENSSVSDGVCSAAYAFCVSAFLSSYQGHGNLTFLFQREKVKLRSQKGRYAYDLRQNDTSTPCPCDFYDPYLNLESIREAIGTNVPFVAESEGVEKMFTSTGDVISSRCHRVRWRFREQWVMLRLVNCDSDQGCNEGFCKYERPRVSGYF